MLRNTITRTVWVLSLVSLFNDVASEMLYPVMPVYLKSIGFSIFIIGTLEGMAEALSGLSKGYFGEMSDRSGRRLPFIRVGYAMSAIAKPVLVLFTNVFWVFAMRTTDRVGKGVRNAARDALLSDEATPETKGRVFGFHRAMDTFGAFLGPAAALLYLHFFPQKYISLFLLAFIPGVLALSLTLFLKEKSGREKKPSKGTAFLSFVRYWKTGSIAYRRLVIGLLLFALFNSSDVFLLLKVKDAGLNDTMVIGGYILYNLVYALFSYPLGHLGDRIGLRPVFIGGLVLFAIVYAGMAFSNSIYVYVVLFFLYGIYAAATEGIAKAWITNVVDKSETATAIGTYTAFQSICALIASSLAGFIWMKAGASFTFLATSIVTVLVVFYFLIFSKRSQ